MKQLLLVFVGGGLGSAARYGVGLMLASYKGQWAISTFGVNMLGSLLIGLIFGLSARHGNLSENTLIFLVAGVCGGFTTFSAFAYENFAYLKNGDILHFFTYSLGSLLLGIISVALGVAAAKLF
jgi:CrcB protein